MEAEETYEDLASDNPSNWAPGRRKEGDVPRESINNIKE